MKRMLAFTLLLLVWGCQPAFINGRPNEHSPAFRVPSGSRLVLQKQVVVPAWQNQVYFQDGRDMLWRSVNIYRPYCTLKTAYRQEVDRVIQPDTFTVKQSATERFFKQVRLRHGNPPVLPVSTGQTLLAASARESQGAMDYEVVAIVMTLGSGAQPEVVSMICADWGLPQDSAHITVAKIRSALGDYFTLELPSIEP
jgi:hypothetical protein